MAFDYDVRPTECDDDDKWSAARFIFASEVLGVNDLYTHEQMAWAWHISSITHDSLDGILECMWDDKAWYEESIGQEQEAQRSREAQAQAKDERRQAARAAKRAAQGW